MLTGLRGPVATRLCPLLLALGCAAEGLRAQDAWDLSGTGIETPRPVADAHPSLQSEVEHLTQRIQGMEGKLRESAVARKAADQARMEAERRLAEGIQELGQLRAEVSLLRDARLALEARVERAEEQAELNAQGLLAAWESVRRLTAERDVLVAEQAATERQASRWPELQQQIGEASLERLRDQAQEQSELRRSLAERESDLKRAQVELRAVQAERDALNRRLDALRAASPDPEGGGLTLPAAKAEAAAAAETLRVRLAQNGHDAASRRASRDAAQELHRRQLRVARLAGARSVYRVEPGDSFARIAARFYGDGRRWVDIQEANLQVVPDPSHLMPGLTLVIP